MTRYIKSQKAGSSAKNVNKLRTQKRQHIHQKNHIHELQGQNHHLQHHINHLQHQLNHVLHTHHLLEEKNRRFNKLILPRILKPLFKTEMAISSANRYRKAFQLLAKDKGGFKSAYDSLKRTYSRKGFKAVKKFLKMKLQEKSIHNPLLENKIINYKPVISVIVPNYNHARFLKDRLDSIINQTYKNIELIILDDKSSDNSVEVIKNYLNNKRVTYKLIVNEQNSGNVFKQWKKGIELATGDWIWICESDDIADKNFLNNMLPVLSYRSVQMAFGRIQFMDSQGNPYEGLDEYRESAEANIWRQTFIRPAFEWFNNAFGIRNVYANASGGLFRRQILNNDIWQKACEYKICGDWYLYLQLAGAGQIAYEPTAVSYFRQHQNNTSASNFHQLYYYQERLAILHEIKAKWDISEDIQDRFIDIVKQEYLHNKMTLGKFETIFEKAINLNINREKIHIQLYFLGFHAGGGELFPIVLANQLYDLGHTVSMVALDLDHINENMRIKLNNAIPVYHISEVLNDSKFLQRAGVDVIHSHIVNADRVITEYLDMTGTAIPYIVTMHGSHTSNHDNYKEEVKLLTEYVSKWIYIADKNLDYFKDNKLPECIKFPNAMPVDARIPDSSRESLRIGVDDIVFVFAARGIPEKGWAVLIQAFLELLQILKIQKNQENKKVHLVLMGSGEAQEQAQKLAQNNPYIHFLGYEIAVNGVFKYSDCLVLPTRFEGESYPLCLIQAIQEKLPCIATDIGEISSMIQDDNGGYAGILIQNNPDDKVFTASLTSAMLDMCDTDNRLSYKQKVENILKRYDMKLLAERYIDVYREVIKKLS